MPYHVLRSIRERVGLSIRQAADLLGVSREALRLIEKGERAPSSETALRMPKVYSLDPVQEERILMAAYRCRRLQQRVRDDDRLRWAVQEARLAGLVRPITGRIMDVAAHGGKMTAEDLAAAVRAAVEEVVVEWEFR